MSTHIATVVASARRTLGFVSRVTKQNGPAAQLILYIAPCPTLVRILRCSVVASSRTPPRPPISVQPHASRTICARIPGHADISYPSRLKVLNWRPLDQMRRTSRVRVLCHLLDRSLPANRLSDVNVSAEGPGNRNHSVTRHRDTANHFCLRISGTF